MLDNMHFIFTGSIYYWWILKLRSFTTLLGYLFEFPVANIDYKDILTYSPFPADFLPCKRKKKMYKYWIEILILLHKCQILKHVLSETFIFSKIHRWYLSRHFRMQQSSHTLQQKKLRRNMPFQCNMTSNKNWTKSMNWKLCLILCFTRGQSYSNHPLKRNMSSLSGFLTL